jgi:uncharacterized DUF497 family protein
LDFRWNEWNVEHLAEHGVSPESAEEVIAGARNPYPRRIGDDKLLVWGASDRGELLQVIFVLDEDGTIFVIHARPLSEAEKRRHRRWGK